MSDLDTTVAALVSSVQAALDGTPGGRPERVCDVPGQLAWDDCQCGLLAVTVGRIYPSTTFPAEAADTQLTSPCPPPYEAVDVTVTVLRCAPTVDSRGNPPSCETLGAAAEIWAWDVEAIRAAVVCCLTGLVFDGTVENWTLRATDPAGPEGGCVGSTTTLTVGLLSCACVG